MSKIKIQSPTRIDIAGGTLDMWPLYNFVGGAKTINLAIDVMTEVEITASDVLTIDSHDLNYRKEFKYLSDLNSCADKELLLYKTVFKNFKDLFKKNFIFKTRSWSPVGGGLGGSSSLIISMLRGLHQFLGLELPETIKLVQWAHNIEAEMLLTPTGTQDYIPAAVGGLNIIGYLNSHIDLKTLSVKDTPFHSQMLVVYTGRSHHSGLNNFEVLKSAVAKDAQVLKALHLLKEVADQMAEAVLQKHWHQLPDLFAQELKARLMLTPAFTSPEIETLRKLSISAGALGFKICGAGGGGCVMIWTKPDDRERIKLLCEEAKFQVLNSQPVNPF